MKALGMTFLVLVLLFSAQTNADLNGAKTRTTCAGPWQLWSYSWNGTGEHAGWDYFHASAKKSTGSVYIVQHGNDQSAFCKNVSTGTPLGQEHHDWKSVATKFPLGAIDSNKTTFYWNTPCRSQGNNP